MPPIRGRSEDTPLESFLKTFPKTPKIIQNGCQICGFSDQFGAKSHPESPKWSPERSKTPPKGPKDGPRAPIWDPKSIQGPFQSAKRSPDCALGATLGSIWGLGGALWVTFGVILDTSGRQRRHFWSKVPELRKRKELPTNPWFRSTRGRPRCRHFGRSGAKNQRTVDTHVRSTHKKALQEPKGGA